MNIILIGPQGSGKGTQARLISEKFGLYYHENGKFIRELSRKDGEIALMINKGILLKDEEMFAFLKDFFEKKFEKIDNILFDGFPRSLPQYRLMKKWLEEKEAKIDYVVFLDISDKEAVRRLSARRSCEKCGEIYNLLTKPPQKESICEKCGGKLIQREDDKPESIEKRLSLYRKNTQPLIEVFEKEGILLRVNGERPIEIISREILGRLER